MTDIALRPDSPKPDAAKPAGGRRASDKIRLRVFISYSRHDLDFADQLNAALTICGFDCVLDRHDISAGEDWKLRLGALIGQSDTIVFVLSPNSATSAVCAWEVDKSRRLGKRILPVVCRPLAGANPPARLQALNFVFFYGEPAAPGSGFGMGLKGLVESLNTDFDWLREHTRYLTRATEWVDGGRPANRLLTGADIAAAKDWVARRPRTAPEPTAVQLDFIHASEQEAEARSSAERQQLETMAEAQRQREAALREAEAAVKQKQEEQRRRAALATIRNVMAVFMAGLALVAGFFFWNAKKQREMAETYLTKATAIIAQVQYQMNEGAQHNAFEMFKTAVKDGYKLYVRYVGVAYRNGWGVAKDGGEARR